MSNLVVPGVMPSVYPLEVPRGCVLYYDMQDIGSIIRDHSGLGNHGTASGAPTPLVGLNGYVRNIDGIDDSIDVAADNPYLNFVAGQSFSIEAWFKMNPVANIRGVLGKISNLSFSGWCIRHQTDGNISFFLEDPLGSGSSIVTSTGDWRGVWVHAVGVCPGNGVPRLYLNGTEFIGGTTVTWSSVNSNLFRIGRLGTGVVMFAQVGIVAVYNIALAKADVLEHYRENAWRYGLKG